MDQKSNNLVHVVYNKTEDFYLYVPEGQGQAFVEQNISEIVGVMNQFLNFTDEDGDTWTYNGEKKYHVVWASHTVLRRNARC